MNPRQILKISVDMVMTVILLVLMAYHLTGQHLHEWLGAGMFVLFAVHNILNYRWYTALFKGRYTVYRALQTIVNLLVLLFMVGQLISGVILSQYAFDFLPISGHANFGRTLHLLGAYWGFALMSLHLGLHWNMILSMVRKITKISKPSKAASTAARIAAAAIALYGAHAFYRYGLLSYMLLENLFVFFDYEQSALSFFTDYLAMMGLWIFIAHYAGKLAKSAGAAPAEKKRGI